MPSRIHGGEFKDEEYSSQKILIGTHVCEQDPQTDTNQL
jgi:hypothetical protein